MKENMKAIIIGLGALIALLALLVTQYENSGPALGGSTHGTSVVVGTTSTMAIGLDEEQLIFGGQQSGINKICGSRIISTRADPILINFAGTSSSTATTTLLSSLEGHLQAASTTVVYDGSLYGCGFWGARSVGVGTTTITITETY